MTLSGLLAHGIGGRSDLPLPAWMFRYGAAATVLASFVALALFWPTARLEGGTAERTLTWTGRAAPRVLVGLVRLFGLVAFFVVLAAAALGENSTPANLAPVAVYVVFWVGLLFVSGFVGDLWRVLSPFETVAVVSDAVRSRRRGGANGERPDGDGNADDRADDQADAEDEDEDGAEEKDEAEDGRSEVTYWVGAAGLLAFVWVELVYPDRAEPRKLFLLLAAYAVVMVVAAVWRGRRWLRHNEAFAALFGVLAHMAPLHRDEEGRLRLRPPFVGLATLDPRPGLEAIVLIGLGSTTYDGVTRTQLWTELTTDLTGASATLASTLGLLWCIGMVAIAYIGAMRVAAGLVGYERSPDQLRADFVHSLVPIVVAYAVAHYFSLLVLEGQATIALVSDPFGQGWDLFGTATRQVDFNLVSPRVISLVQCGAIVVGHVAGVVIAHDRGMALFDRRLATRSQYPLLAVMVLFTVGGLFLLLGG